MDRLIRRHSMERLELYDLDKLTNNHQLPPPLPPPRKPLIRRPSMNPSFERYQFLCNMTRSKTDPIYAATPMFTTIPQSSQEKSHRQLIGSYIRLENVTPILPTIPTSPEPKKSEIIEDKKEKDEKENEAKEDGDVDDKESQFSSSSSDEQEVAGGNDDDDGDDKKGIIEQILNRDKTD